MALPILEEKKLNPEQYQNIIVILIDTLRHDSFEINDFNNLIANSLNIPITKFKNAFSNSPWTKPSVVSLFTSTSPNQNGTFRRKTKLSLKFTTLAEVLKNFGYKTIFINSGNPHLDLNTDVTQGFEKITRFHPRAKADIVLKKSLKILKGQKGSFFSYIHLMDTHLPYNKNQFSAHLIKQFSLGLGASNIREATFKKNNFSN